jgi:hypothetical protein
MSCIYIISAHEIVRTNSYLQKLGEDWIMHLEQLQQLKQFAEDTNFQRAVQKVKQENEMKLAQLLQKDYGLKVNPASMFDIQVNTYPIHWRIVHQKCFCFMHYNTAFSSNNLTNCVAPEPKGDDCIHKRVPMVHILSKVNPLNTPTPPTPANFSKVHFYPIFPSIPWSFKWSLSLRLSHLNPIQISPLSHA